MINIKEIKPGDIFSEQSYYVVKKINPNDIVFTHLDSCQEVVLGTEYVKNLLDTSDQYEKEVIVTKEDKKDGTLGIRSIFENISSQVFTVVFKKQDGTKTKKAYLAELESQRTEAIALIDKAKKNKKSMAEAYKEALEFVQNNPVKDYVEGEDRVLRGYKIQFTSRDGKYNCIDIDLKNGSGVSTAHGTSACIRPVNINTITTLIVNGIKYIVK